MASHHGQGAAKHGATRPSTGPAELEAAVRESAGRFSAPVLPSLSLSGGCCSLSHTLSLSLTLSHSLWRLLRGSPGAAFLPRYSPLSRTLSLWRLMHSLSLSLWRLLLLLSLTRSLSPTHTLSLSLARSLTPEAAARESGGCFSAQRGYSPLSLSERRLLLFLSHTHSLYLTLTLGAPDCSRVRGPLLCPGILALPHLIWPH
jgi:hypothetical protein